MSKKNRKHSEPFIKIGSEILNSPAYIDLGFSARSMLIEILHFYNGRNNGYIWISKEVLHQRGFSRNTATNALKELRSHGFLYMTKRGGNITGGCSWYAITWQPVNQVKGQDLVNFNPHAYKKWMPKEIINRSKFGAVQTQNMGLEPMSMQAH